MAQSALTVTPPNPTPPTNISVTGATPPNPPNLRRDTYADWAPDTDFDTAPPPYFDDGITRTEGTKWSLNENIPPSGVSASPQAFAVNVAALASGTSAADNAGGTADGGAGGTGINNAAGTYPGAVNGLVPASTSIPHEGAGTETVVTLTYPPAYTGATPHPPLKTVSTIGNYTLTPNASHPSYLTGTVGVGIPTTSAASGASNVAGPGTTLLTVTGTNFNRSSVVYVNGVAQTTNYVSATSLTVTNAPKKATAGTLPVTVVNGVGGMPSNATNWTFT